MRIVVANRNSHRSALPPITSHRKTLTMASNITPGKSSRPAPAVKNTVKAPTMTSQFTPGQGNAMPMMPPKSMGPKKGPSKTTLKGGKY